MATFHTFLCYEMIIDFHRFVTLLSLFPRDVRRISVTSTLLVSALVRKLHLFLLNAYSHPAKRYAHFGVLTFLHQYLKCYKFLSPLLSSRDQLFFPL